MFRQLFDPESSTYTYLLADEHTRDAILVDPVKEMVERDLEQLAALGLALRFTVETHVHADHVTGASSLRRKTGCRTVLSRAAGVPCADVLVDEGDVVRAGSLALRVLSTPGHTSSCITLVDDAAGRAFTGDALLIRGCGRTDFQQGDPQNLYRSVRDKILALPAETRLYPAHDYRGRTVTTVAEERALNPRLKDGIDEATFTSIMAGLKLAMPKKIHVAVPANLVCGDVPDTPPSTPPGFVGGEGI